MRSDQSKMVIPLWDQILVPSLPPSQGFTKWIMCPLCWSDQLFASLKKTKLCFCHWFSHMESSHHPFLGLKLLSRTKSTISLCFVSVSDGEILNSSCTKLLLNCILFWNFASLWLGRSGHPNRLWMLSTVCTGSVLIFKFLSLPITPLLVRSVRFASCSLLA